MTKTTVLCAGAAAVLLAGCETMKKVCCCPCKKDDTVKLITLDPGHFHAALIQKRMYPGVSPKVHVYAPEGSDLKMHLERINGFNTRKDDPTKWET